MKEYNIKLYVHKNLLFKFSNNLLPIMIFENYYKFIQLVDKIKLIKYFEFSNSKLNELIKSLFIIIV